MRDERIAEIDARVVAWRQGDCVLAESHFLYRIDPAHPISGSAAEASQEGFDAAEEEVAGFVVLTQSCNLVRSCAERPFVEVSPLVEVDNDALEDIRKGRRPQYGWIRGVAGRNLVADLDRVMTIEKAVLANWERVEGSKSGEDVRAFALALSRHRTRSAFPDDFVEAVEGLRKRISKKHDKGSPEGEALRALREIRVRAAPSWDAQEVDVMFFFIRHEEALEFNGTPWHVLLDGWLSRVPDQGRFRVSGLVVTLDDLTARDLVGSDPLDLDHLSDPPAV